jgi:hypothetical protein
MPPLYIFAVLIVPLFTVTAGWPSAAKLGPVTVATMPGLYLFVVWMSLAKTVVPSELSAVMPREKKPLVEIRSAAT